MSFDLGFLSTPLSTYTAAGVVNCFVTDSQGNMDFNWSTIDQSSLSALKLAPALELNSATWTFRCQGGAAPDGSSTTKANFKLERSSTSIQATDTNNLIPIPKT